MGLYVVGVRLVHSICVGSHVALGPVGGIGDGKRPGLVGLEVVGRFGGQLYCVFVGML